MIRILQLTIMKIAKRCTKFGKKLKLKGLRDPIIGNVNFEKKNNLKGRLANDNVPLNLFRSPLKYN